MSEQPKIRMMVEVDVVERQIADPSGGVDRYLEVDHARVVSAVFSGDDSMLAALQYGTATDYGDAAETALLQHLESMNVSRDEVEGP